MSVELLSRLVELRNSSRKEPPAATALGLRAQAEETANVPSAVAVMVLAAAEAAPVPTELIAETR